MSVPDGHGPVLGGHTGTPRGPRVKRPGWSGWWVPDEDGTGPAWLYHGMVHRPDPAYPEPRRLVLERPPEPVSAIHPPAPQLLPCPAGHDLRWRRYDRSGHLICDVCKRFARMKAKRAA